MKMPTLAAVVVWISGQTPDCRRAWSKKCVQRWFDVKPPAAPAQPVSLTRALQASVTRYRRGEQP